MKIAGCVISYGTGVIRFICAGAIINKEIIAEVSSYYEPVNAVVFIHVSILSCSDGTIQTYHFNLKIDGSIREVVSVLFTRRRGKEQKQEQEGYFI